MPQWACKDKNVIFAKMWPLTWPNVIKYWRRTKIVKRNREISARHIDWSLPRSSSSIRGRSPGGSYQLPDRPSYEKCNDRAVVKGIIIFFPKCISYSVEGVDEGGWPQQPMVFFLKIDLLTSPSKLIRLPDGTSASRLQVLLQICLQPHWLNIGNDFLTTGCEFRYTR